ncbi:MAG: T9SS type A sorting domain-containing protein [Bacteroidota bacterium]|nr:T9SS type A sorting domain-containing protein [Bacteroidota bacterium]MDP3146449.1 T9SS type A sorting domain-containing protein [Bacteroidota bacterium]MDP3557435.1 T9SS type A sorting domain-containing protein [Bacteroidota bacterium]
MKKNYIKLFTVAGSFILAINSINAQCVIPPTPTITGNGACGSFPLTTTLTATGASTLQTGWYANSFGGNAVGTGSTYATPSLTASTVYYAAQLAATTTESLTLPSQSSPFSGNVRGYYFTAPTSFVITGVRVPTDANSGNASVAIIKFPTVPPLYSTVTNTFDILYLVQNVVGTGTMSVNIPVYSGDIIGVLGVRNDVNSYAPAPYISNLGTNTLTLNRLGMQFPLSTTVPQDLWTENGGSISRTELYTTLGCINALTAYTVNANPNPTVSITGGTTTVCAGTPVSLTANGAVTYTWNTAATSSTIAPTPTTNTTYSVVGASATGCTGTALQTVSVNPSPSVSAVSSTSLLCVGQTASLTASGASSYTWNTAATTTIIAVSPSVTTIYTVTGTNALGCTANYTISQAVSVCSGLTSNQNTTSSLRSYPNPTNGLFTIETANGATKTIIVSDITGRVIMDNTSNSETVNLNISHFANGIYYIKVQSDNITEIIKVVKQ